MALVSLGMVVLIVAITAGDVTHAQFFSPKPVYIDPRLEGWVAPLQTLCFEAGCGELYYVVGVYRGESRDLHVISRSQVTLRRFDRKQLDGFAEKLARSLTSVVQSLAEEGTLDGVVLTFYLTFLKDNFLSLEIYESRRSVHAFGSTGPLPLRVVERRMEELPLP